MRTTGAALLTLTLLFAAGCGGGSDDKKPSKAETSSSVERPELSELAGSLAAVKEKKKGKKKATLTYTDRQAGCIATILEKSKLSNEALRSIAENPKTYRPTGKDAEVISKLAVKISTCLLDELATATPTALPLATTAP